MPDTAGAQQAELAPAAAGTIDGADHRADDAGHEEQAEQRQREQLRAADRLLSRGALVRPGKRRREDDRAHQGADDDHDQRGRAETAGAIGSEPAAGEQRRRPVRGAEQQTARALLRDPRTTREQAGGDAEHARDQAEHRRGARPEQRGRGKPDQADDEDRHASAAERRPARGRASCERVQELAAQRHEDAAAGEQHERGQDGDAGHDRGREIARRERQPREAELIDDGARGGECKRTDRDSGERCQAGFERGHRGDVAGGGAKHPKRGEPPRAHAHADERAERDQHQHRQREQGEHGCTLGCGHSL